MKDINALNDLAHEISVCFKKAGNFYDTAKARVAVVADAIDAGEYGEEWTTQRWLTECCDVLDRGEAKKLLPPPTRERLAAVIQKNPTISQRMAAELLGVSQPRIKQIWPVENYSPERIIGRDGKSYPRRVTNDPELEEAVQWFQQASVRKQDEFLKRINAVRV